MAADLNTTLVALHESGHTTRQIEAIVGNLDHSTIARRLKHLTPRKTTQIYRELRADVLAEKQRKLLMSSDGENARNQADIAKAFKSYYECERTERGQANVLVGHGIAITLSPALQEMADKLLNRYAKADNPVDKPGCQPSDESIDI
jgi:hypothetical protein